jgi:type III pantothenate kinase
LEAGQTLAPRSDREGPMLLAIDVGNTNIVFGLFAHDADDERVVQTSVLKQFRIETVRTRTGDEYAATLAQLFTLHGIALGSVKHAVVASVVPSVTRAMTDLVATLCGAKTLVIGSKIHTGMPILYDNPKELGADRIVNAVAAFEKVQDACIVIDLGTATTFDCVSAKGEYLGGTICPGILTGADALSARAAKLPRIEIAEPNPPRAMGKSTMHSMQSGVVYGYVGMIEGLCARLAGEMGATPRVLATGGFSSLLAPLTSAIHEVDPDLTLFGLRLLHQRNQGKQRG